MQLMLNKHLSDRLFLKNRKKQGLSAVIRMVGRRAAWALGLFALIGMAFYVDRCDAEGGIRGLDPALQPKYEPVDGQFACLDGKKSVPFDQLNDNYCDCFDGSDEPGGRF